MSPDHALVAAASDDVEGGGCREESPSRSRRLAPFALISLAVCAVVGALIVHGSSGGGGAAAAAAPAADLHSSTGAYDLFRDTVPKGSVSRMSRCGLKEFGDVRCYHKVGAHGKFKDKVAATTMEGRRRRRKDTQSPTPAPTAQGHCECSQDKPCADAGGGCQAEVSAGGRHFCPAGTRRCWQTCTATSPRVVLQKEHADIEGQPVHPFSMSEDGSVMTALHPSWHLIKISNGSTRAVMETETGECVAAGGGGAALCRGWVNGRSNGEGIGFMWTAEGGTSTSFYRSGAPPTMRHVSPVYASPNGVYQLYQWLGSREEHPFYCYWLNALTRTWGQLGDLITDCLPIYISNDGVALYAQNAKSFSANVSQADQGDNVKGDEVDAWNMKWPTAAGNGHVVGVGPNRRDVYIQLKGSNKTIPAESKICGTNTEASPTEDCEIVYVRNVNKQGYAAGHGRHWTSIEFPTIWRPDGTSLPLLELVQKLGYLSPSDAAFIVIDNDNVITMIVDYQRFDGNGQPDDISAKTVSFRIVPCDDK